MNWATEVFSDGEWVGNGIVLATKEEADSYGGAMLFTCILFKDVRTIRSEKPVNYRWEDGHLVRLDKPVEV